MSITDPFGIILIDLVPDRATKHARATLKNMTDNQVKVVENYSEGILVKLGSEIK